MQGLKRILAVLVMIISVLVVLVTIAGIFGTWIITSNLSANLVEVVTRAEMRVNNLALGLDQLESGLVNAGDQISRMQDNLQFIGEAVEENKPLLTAISDGLGSRIEPFLSSAGQVVTTVIDAAATVNGAVETLNALPFVSIQSPEFDRIDTLSQSFEELQLQVQDARMAIDQQQSNLIESAVSIISTPLSKIGDGLDGLESTVAGYSEEVGIVQANLAAFRDSVQRWLTLLAVIITLILLWLAFSQVGLFVLAWRYYNDEDLEVDPVEEISTNADLVESDQENLEKVD